MGTLYVKQGGSMVEQGGGGSGGSSGTGAVSVPSTTITASATPHTKGSPTQLVASLGFTASTLIVHVYAGTLATSTDTSGLVDIMIGAASSETVLVPNLQVGFTQSHGCTYVIPIAIASGTRISARSQSAVSSGTVGIALEVFESGDYAAAPTTCTAYGVNTSTSRGTTLTTVGSINTKGSWTDLDTNTADDMTRLLVGHGGVSATTTACTGLVDIGLWNGSAYDVIVADLPFETNTSEAVRYLPRYPFAVNIPAGSRIGARYQATNTNSSCAPSISVYGLS